MDRIRYRDLQRWPYTDLKQVLPIAVTYDSQAELVVMTIETYNRLVSSYKRQSS